MSAVLPRLQLHRPHYAGDGDGTMLHRYLEDQFIPRFMQDAVAGRLAGSAAQAWREQDRFGRRRDLPTLRLPMHRAFYVCCCEASCIVPGMPAVDPARIRSAGMVVRRGGDGAAARWMLQDGEPTGWQSGAVPEHEPDEHRRLVGRRLIAPRVPEPPPSGEQVHPLHKFVVESERSGRRRKHTLLFGYLPLGGSWRAGPEPFSGSGDDGPDFSAEHLWPFGSRGRPLVLQAMMLDLSAPSTAGLSAEKGFDAEPPSPWRQAQGLVMTDGRPNEALHGLLETLVGRYRVQDPALPENEALRTLLGRIHLYDPPPSIDESAGGDPTLTPAHRVRSLRVYLDRRAEQVLEWLGAVQRGDSQRRLPAYEGAASPDSEAALGRLDDALYVTEQQAEQLRDLLVLRARAASEGVVDGLPLPRFGQDDSDVYFAKPFIRVLDAAGCEGVIWGPASLPFRVAAPLDPDAARPQLVALPELDDVKRGVAKGLTMLSPKSLADKIQQIRLDMDVEKDPSKANHAGACASFSFSLPVITICALILLMIMIQLLNIIFYWLPYAFLALPRLCLSALGQADSSDGSGTPTG